MSLKAGIHTLASIRTLLMSILVVCTRMRTRVKYLEQNFLAELGTTLATWQRFGTIYVLGPVRSGARQKCPVRNSYHQNVAKSSDYILVIFLLQETSLMGYVTSYLLSNLGWSNDTFYKTYRFQTATSRPHSAARPGLPSGSSSL